MLSRKKTEVSVTCLYVSTKHVIKINQEVTFKHILE